ncbi:MAG: STAS domain-containing protein [Deltaproteobacteria bacterium]|jgi:anti-anti-sigma factor|nr:STAS domain-containing protein [Deltaproteobacteria bacterium]
MKPFVHKTLIGNFFDVPRAGVSSAGSASAPPPTGETRQHDAVIAVFSGDFSLTTLPGFASSLENLLTGLRRVIVLDLSGVRRFSANAAGVLVNFLAGVEGRNKRLILYRPSPTVSDMLASLNLTHLFETQQTEDELLLDLPD